MGQKGRNILWAGPKNVTNIESGKPSEIDFSLYWEAWNKLKQKAVVAPDTQKMIYGSISGMFDSLADPYTVFLTPDENKRFREDIQGEFDGIGVEIVAKNGLPTVVAPLSDTPAEKAGLKPNDIISEVDGTKTADLGIEGAISKIRGTKGTTVKITIIRAGSEQPLSFDIVRDTIVVKSVKWEKKTQAGKQIYVVKIRQFGDDTDSLFANFASEVIKEKPDGIIIDLRNNPGGYLETAVDLASYYLDSGVVVSEKGRDGVSHEYNVTRKATLKNFKTVILVNAGSASASEIFSGALQDRGLAQLIGEKTFGKGCVQELIELSDGSAAKITVANWFTPKGRAISGEGIAPDIAIENPDGATSDLQLDKALETVAK